MPLRNILVILIAILAMASPAFADDGWLTERENERLWQLVANGKLAEFKAGLQRVSSGGEAGVWDKDPQREFSIVVWLRPKFTDKEAEMAYHLIRAAKGFYKLTNKRSAQSGSRKARLTRIFIWIETETNSADKPVEWSETLDQILVRIPPNNTVSAAKSTIRKAIRSIERLPVHRAGP